MQTKSVDRIGDSQTNDVFDELVDNLAKLDSNYKNELIKRATGPGWADLAEKIKQLPKSVKADLLRSAGTLPEMQDVLVETGSSLLQKSSDMEASVSEKEQKTLTDSQHGKISKYEPCKKKAQEKYGVPKEYA